MADIYIDKLKYKLLFGYEIIGMPTEGENSKSQKSKDKPEASGVSFPRDTLKKSLTLAQAIASNNAGKPYERLLLAKATKWSPNSSRFRSLITSSGRYGLTNGGYQAEKISLTDTGTAIVKPMYDGERESALRKALLTPDLFKKVIEYYDNNMLPSPELFKNALESVFHVANKDVESAYNIITENMKDYGILENISGKYYVMLSKLSTGEQQSQIEVHPSPSGVIKPGNNLPPEDKSPDEPEEVKQPEKPKKIFVAHGKNKKPLEQLKTILNSLPGVKYVVAIDEPHSGRPISEKVSELMRECTSGIFIFTADEEHFDADRNKILKPSENVVFELGAGTVLYGRKIVIFREEGTTFGSDFTDFGYITFEKDKLDAKGMELFRELLNLGFIKVQNA